MFSLLYHQNFSLETVNFTQNFSHSFKRFTIRPSLPFPKKKDQFRKVYFSELAKTPIFLFGL